MTTPTAPELPITVDQYLDFCATVLTGEGTDVLDWMETHVDGDAAYLFLLMMAASSIVECAFFPTAGDDGSFYIPVFLDLATGARTIPPAAVLAVGQVITASANGDHDTVFALLKANLEKSAGEFTGHLISALRAALQHRAAQIAAAAGGGDA